MTACQNTQTYRARPAASSPPCASTARTHTPTAAYTSTQTRTPPDGNLDAGELATSREQDVGRREESHQEPAPHNARCSVPLYCCIQLRRAIAADSPGWLCCMAVGGASHDGRRGVVGAGAPRELGAAAAARQTLLRYHGRHKETREGDRCFVFFLFSGCLVSGQYGQNHFTKSKPVPGLIFAQYC